MGGYVANFTVYTMAMIGLICFAVFVYKKIMDGSLGKKHTRYIEIEDTLNLNPRKTLHVIRAGEEKFLIASDMDRTTLISKLNDNKPELPVYEKYQDSRQTFRNAIDIAQQKQTIQEKTQTPKRVHLEPITRKHDHGIGISNIRHSMDTRAGRTVQSSAPVRKQVQSTVQKQSAPAARPAQATRTAAAQKPAKVALTGSTIKDMAKKINQL